ncbi:MAG: hypothetical protein MUP47_06785 [Phycisphaerae bacterium]|nr:hypothetical protein [Phycisphaerae bacterium]
MTDWQDIVSRHSGLVWRTAYRLLGDDALFSVTPPADYQVTNLQMPLTKPTEADLVAGLRWLAENNDNTFPPTLAPTGRMIERVQEQEKASKEKYEGLSEQEKVQKVLEITGPMARMTVYAQMTNDFRYVGAGVSLGDAGRILCRYKPPGSETYRVVYGDLHVADAPAEPQTQPSAETE